MRNYTCWICLEDCDFKSSWIFHDCGCNLQAHKKCLIQWLYTSHKKNTNGYMDINFCRIEKEETLKNKILRHVDLHRSFHENTGLLETLQSLPIISHLWNRLGNFSGKFSRYALKFLFPRYKEYSLDYSSFIIDITCPQCKQNITQNGVKWHRRDISLIFLHISKIICKYSTICLTILLFTTNFVKWWFRLGLWQLRCIFPESILRRSLNICTTTALDIYGDRITSIKNVHKDTLFLILGFPLYVTSLYHTKILTYFRMVYSLILTNGNRYSKLISTILTVRGLIMICYNWVNSNMTNKIYTKWLRNGNFYFQESRCDFRELAYETYLEDRSSSNIIIRTTWWEMILQSIIWPWIGGQISKYLISKIPKITTLILYIDKDATPDECYCLMNFFGFGLLPVISEAVKLFLSYRRLKELHELQELIE